MGLDVVVAMLSPVAGGMIRTWTETETTLWGVDKPAELAAVIGSGAIARAAVADNLFREVGLLDAAAGRLVVQVRDTSAAGEARALAAEVAEAGAVEADAVESKALVFQLSEPSGLTNNPWDDLQDFVAAAALGAAQRGEFLSVESGGWDASPTPSFFFTLTEEDGEVVSVIEASPPPRGTEVWPEVPADQEGCSLSAPLGEDTLEVVAAYAASALDSWGLDPWAVAVTFGSPEALGQD